MKISSLVRELTRFQNVYGDVEVAWNRDIESDKRVSVVSVYGLPEEMMVCLSETDYTDTDFQGADRDGPRKQNRPNGGNAQHHTV